MCSLGAYLVALIWGWYRKFFAGKNGRIRCAKRGIVGYLEKFSQGL